MNCAVGVTSILGGHIVDSESDVCSSSCSG